MESVSLQVKEEMRRTVLLQVWHQYKWLKYLKLKPCHKGKNNWAFKLCKTISSMKDGRTKDQGNLADNKRSAIEELRQYLTAQQTKVCCNLLQVQEQLFFRSSTKTTMKIKFIQEKKWIQEPIVCHSQPH
jgi:hypothetical protein